MTALLFRYEFTPGDAQTLPVPTASVWKLLFEHEELSALTLFSGRQRLGELNVQPRNMVAAGVPWHRLTGTGAFVLNLPGLDRERIVFHGTLDLDDREDVQRLEVAATFHEPNQPLSGTTVVFDGQPPRGQWHYLIRVGRDVRKENSGTVQSLLDDPDLRVPGFDPKMFARWDQLSNVAVAVAARHGTLHLNGEDLETYVVTIRQADGPESSIYLNQLGRILAVKTFFGYNLYDNAFNP